MSRACSYCRNNGHNIRSCIDPRIDIAIADMREKFILNGLNMPDRMDRDSYNSARSRFQLWLYRKFDASTIRVVAYRLGVGNLTGSKDIGIHMIVVHFVNECTRNRLREVVTMSLLQSYRDTMLELVALHDDGPMAIASRTNNLITMKVNNNNNNNNTTENFDCPICLDCVDNSKCVTLNCNHKFCSTCFSELLKSNTTRQIISCSLCRTTVTNLEVCSMHSCEKLNVYNERIQQVC